MQSSLLSAAVVAALAVSAVSFAGDIRTSSPVLRAQAALNGATATRLLKRDAADRLVVRDTVAGRKGMEHVRFERTYRGLPVIGGGGVMHLKNGNPVSASQNLKSGARPASIVPSITSTRAITEAGTRFGTAFTGKPSARLVVYARGGIAPKLAYEVRYTGFKRDQTETDMRYIVDAHSARLLDKWDTVHTAKPGPDGNGCTSGTAAVGTGNSLFVGQVELDTTKCGTNYRLTDATRGGGYTHNMANRTAGLGTPFVDTDNVWGNGTNTSSQTVAVDAHFGVATTWDYFQQEHGRSGIANDGKGALSRVHYGRNYANASWSDACFCMTFGDGNGSSVKPLVVLDVAGHEMSHGVTSRSADLIYSGESGGLNEGTSDIFGTLVEYFADDEADPGDYLIGEGIYRQNPNQPYTTALRYMFKPSLDGASADCYDASVGGMDVHYSSGVANHFFYLLAEGAVVPDGWGAGTGADLAAADIVCDGNTSLAGIGREDAGKIWYLALTGYMQEDTDYAGARVATLDAATELFGASSTQVAAVAAAWDAVAVAAE